MLHFCRQESRHLLRQPMSALSFELTPIQ